MTQPPLSASLSSICIQAWLALLLLGLTANATAACTGFQPNWLWNYDGRIGDKYQVRMTLTSDNSQVNGVYFYATQLKDIRLKGRILDGTRIVLDELDAAGTVVSRFEGAFMERDPKGKYGDSKLQCEVIVGSWYKLNSTSKLPIYLALADSTAGSLEHRYALIGVEDDEVVHRNARRFVEAVKRGDKSAVASLIVYPIDVSLMGTPKRIRGPEELVANYDSIFLPECREAVSRALPRNMFVRDQGIMLNACGVWFNADGKIISL